MSVVRISQYGALMARLARAACLSKTWSEAAEVARDVYGPGVVAAACKAAVTSVGSDDLIAPQETVGYDFNLGVQAASAIGRMRLRRIPLRTRVITANQSGVAYWVGERARIGATLADLSGQQLDTLKIASLLAVTDELIRSADAEAENFLRQLLTNAAAVRLDETFLDPANAGVADISPRAATYGAPTAVSSGVARADLRALQSMFGGNMDTAVLVTDPSTALSLALALGLDTFGPRGGEVLTIPVIVTRGSPSSTSGGQLTMVDVSQVAYGDSATVLDRSDASTVELNDAPAGNAASVVVSVWQANLHLLRLIQHVNWSVVGEGAVSVITGASYDD